MKNRGEYQVKSDLNFQYGLEEYKKRNLDLAIKWFEAAIQDNPSNAKAYLALGNAKCDLHQFDDAMSAFTKSIELGKKTKSYEGLQVAEAAYAKRADIKIRKHKNDEAEDDLRSALKINPSNPTLHFSLGLILGKKGDLKEALACFNWIIEISQLVPNVISETELVEAHKERAKILSLLGRSNLAQQDFEIASKTSHSDDNAILYYQRGITFLNQRLFDDAMHNFNTALSYEEKPDFYHMRAMASLAKKEYLDASDDLNKVMRSSKKNPTTFLYCAIAWMTYDNLDQAKKYFSRAWKSPVTQPLITLYSGIRLLELSPDADRNKILLDIKKLRDNLAYKDMKSAEELCVLALAQACSGQYKEAKNTCWEFMVNFLPNSIPLYLQTPFIELLLNHQLGSFKDLSLEQSVNKGQLKDQLKTMINGIEDNNLAVNAALQALCSNTTLGSIFHIPRLAKTPSIKSGRLQQIAIALNNRIKNMDAEHTDSMEVAMKNMDTAKIVITNETKFALQKEVKLNPSFAIRLRIEFPFIYKMISHDLVTNSDTITNSHSLFSYTPAVIDKPIKSKPSIQDDGGNRFIQRGLL